MRRATPWLWLLRCCAVAVIGVANTAVVLAQEPGIIRLSPAQPSAEWSVVIEAPGYGVLGYKVFGIDVSSFRTGGVLTVDVFVAPDSKTAGSFNIFPEGVRIPTEGHPYESVAGAYDVPPGVHARLEYRFERGQTVSFGADGNWFSPTGAQGRALVRASVAGVSSQGGSFEGEYVNSEFGFGFRIQGRQGVATLSNSPNYQVGDVMLTFVETSPTEFRGQQLCTDGRFHPVTGVLNEAGNLEMTIEGCSPTRYTMARQREPADVATAPPVGGPDDSNELGLITGLCGSGAVQLALAPDYVCFNEAGDLDNQALICAAKQLVGYRAVYFGVACRGHDQCYDRSGSIKSECDSSFRVSLEASCDETFPEPGWVQARSSCRQSAATYYRVVDEWACDAFTAAQERAGNGGADCR